MQIDITFRKCYSCKDILVTLHICVHIVCRQVPNVVALTKRGIAELYSVPVEEPLLHHAPQLEEAALSCKVLTVPGAAPEGDKVTK